MNEFDSKVIDCVASLYSAIQDCRGGCYKHVLDMTVRDFCGMFGRNDIKFVYSPPSKKQAVDTLQKEFNGTFREALLLLPPVLRNPFLEMSSKNIVLSEKVEELESLLETASEPYISHISLSGVSGRFKGIREVEAIIEEPKENGDFCTSYSFSPEKMTYTV